MKNKNLFVGLIVLASTSIAAYADGSPFYLQAEKNVTWQDLGKTDPGLENNNHLSKPDTVTCTQCSLKAENSLEKIAAQTCLLPDVQRSKEIADTWRSRLELLLIQYNYFRFQNPELAPKGKDKDGNEFAVSCIPEDISSILKRAKCQESSIKQEFKRIFTDTSSTKQKTFQSVADLKKDLAGKIEFLHDKKIEEEEVIKQAKLWASKYPPLPARLCMPLSTFLMYRKASASKWARTQSQAIVDNADMLIREAKSSKNIKNGHELIVSIINKLIKENKNAEVEKFKALYASFMGHPAGINMLYSPLVNFEKTLTSFKASNAKFNASLKANGIQRFTDDTHKKENGIMESALVAEIADKDFSKLLNDQEEDKVVKETLEKTCARMYWTYLPQMLCPQDVYDNAVRENAAKKVCENSFSSFMDKNLMLPINPDKPKDEVGLQVLQGRIAETYVKESFAACSELKKLNPSDECSFAPVGDSWEKDKKNSSAYLYYLSKAEKKEGFIDGYKNATLIQKNGEAYSCRTKKILNPTASRIGFGAVTASVQTGVTSTAGWDRTTMHNDMSTTTQGRAQAASERASAANVASNTQSSIKNNSFQNIDQSKHNTLNNSALPQKADPLANIDTSSSKKEISKNSKNETEDDYSNDESNAPVSKKRAKNKKAKISGNVPTNDAINAPESNSINNDNTSSQSASKVAATQSAQLGNASIKGQQEGSVPTAASQNGNAQSASISSSSSGSSSGAASSAAAGGAASKDAAKADSKAGKDSTGYKEVITDLSLTSISSKDLDALRSGSIASAEQLLGNSIKSDGIYRIHVPNSDEEFIVKVEGGKIKKIEKVTKSKDKKKAKSAKKEAVKKHEVKKVEVKKEEEKAPAPHLLPKLNKIIEDMLTPKKR